MLVGRFLARPICHILGYLYPAYQSYKAVKTNDPSLHTQWLTFWIVSTYISIVEVLGDTLLSWLPFYYEAKVALLFWLVAPKFQGAAKLYDNFVNPYLHRYEKDIDAGVEQLKFKGAKQLSAIGMYGVRHIRSQSSEILKYGTQVLLSQTNVEGKIEEKEGKEQESKHSDYET